MSKHGKVIYSTSLMAHEESLIPNQHLTLLEPKKLRDSCEQTMKELYGPYYNLTVARPKLRKRQVSIDKPYFSQYLAKHVGILGKIQQLARGSSRKSMKLPEKKITTDMIDKLLEYFLRGVPGHYTVEYAPPPPFEVEIEVTLNDKQTESLVEVLTKGETKINGTYVRVMMMSNGYGLTKNPGRPVKYFTPSAKDVLRFKQFIKDLTTEGIEPNPGPRRQATTRKNVSRRRPRRNRRRNPKSANKFNGPNPRATVIGPPLTTSKLVYQSDLTTISGGDYAVKAFQLCLNDMDPAVFSTTIAGVERFADYYTEYLNKSAYVDARITNTSGSAVNFYMIMSTADLTGIISTWQMAKDVAENANATKIVTWNTNVDTKSIKRRFYPANLMRRSVYIDSEIYAGLYNANPVSPIFINLVWYSTNSGATVRVDTDIRITLMSDWYIQRIQDDNGPITEWRPPSARPPYKFTDEQKVINHQNSLTWGYPPHVDRREYEHKAGQVIMFTGRYSEPVGQKKLERVNSSKRVPPTSLSRQQ